MAASIVDHVEENWTLILLGAVIALLVQMVYDTVKSILQSGLSAAVPVIAASGVALFVLALLSVLVSRSIRLASKYGEAEKSGERRSSLVSGPPDSFPLQVGR